MKKTVLSDYEIATAKLQARDWFLSQNEVPSLTDMRQQLGIDLANVLISNFDSITKRIMNIDDNDHSKPHKVKMNIPIRTTYQDICDHGDRIELKIINHMLKDSLAEQLVILKQEFCEDLQRQQNDLLLEYDQLKQDILANMKYLFERDEFDYCRSQNKKRLLTNKLIIDKFNEVKPLVLKAVAIRIQKIISRENSTFLKQRSREQQRVYMKLKDIILSESHIKNVKYMFRILNEFGTSLSDQIQSILGTLLVNNIYLILKERLKFQTKVKDLKEKLKFKFQCMVDKCEQLLTQPVVTEDRCPHVELWKQKCLWLIDNYESYIESTTNKKKDHGKYFLDVERLMANFESISQHDHGFYECSYKSGGIMEYFDRAKPILLLSPRNLPVITQQVHRKTKKISTNKPTTENVPPFIVKSCYDRKADTSQNLGPQCIDSDSSISSIEYQGHTYASLKNYDRVANTLYPNSTDESEIPVQAKFHWGDYEKDSVSEEENEAVDEVVEIAENFRNELLHALDLTALSAHIFNMIMESTTKMALLKSTSTIEERRDNHGTMFIPPVSSINSNEIQIDSLNLLLEVENKLVKCINNIVTPASIMEFIRKIEQAKTVKRRRLFRARDSVMLTEKKLQQNKLYSLHRHSGSNENIDIVTDEPQEDDYNPPLYFHQNSLNFHYVFDSYLKKINGMIPDGVELPNDMIKELESSMRARSELNFVDFAKQKLKNLRVLKKLNQRPKLMTHSILRTQNHFKTREKIDNHISQMQLDKLMEILDKIMVK